MLPAKHDSLRIMSHCVVGYPSLEENTRAIDELVAAGVNLIELQVPFSDPVADGHTLVNACVHALEQGGSFAATLALAKTVSTRHPDATFILMSYLNPLYRYGIHRAIDAIADAGFKGMIIPDWPVEELAPYLPKCDERGLCPILMVTPNTPEERMAEIVDKSRGMLYVVSRMGVTGSNTQWGEPFQKYIEKVRRLTELPLAVGFGVRSQADLDALNGKVEVAAFCSRYIEWQGTVGSQQAAERMAELVNAIA